MTPPVESIDVTHDGAVARVLINRPSVRNALTRQMMIELEQQVRRLDELPGCRVILLTGAGDLAFCAGADLGSSVADTTRLGYDPTFSDVSKRFLSETTKPVVAAVNGYCIAGGLEILLGTDVRIAATHATFGLAEVRWGMIPAGGSHVRLPDQLPWPVAMELLLTGAPMSAARARSVGLVNAVVPATDLMAAARAICRRIASHAAGASEAAKGLSVAVKDHESRFQYESERARRVFISSDAVEGPRAFVERRRPHFHGE